MKLKLIGRAGTASMLSLAMTLGVTSCSNDYTAAYVYMTTSKALPHGLINGYQVDYQSGLLRQLPDSPIDTGGRNTVALVVAPNDLFLYTVNNFDSNVVEFAIGTDGKLYPQHTYETKGSLPTAAAIDASGKFLYVTFTYQYNSDGSVLYTPANPGPGGISIFPINSDNTLGKPTTVNVGRNPVGITTVTSGGKSYVYVIEQDSAITTNTVTGNKGTNNLLAFSEDTTNSATAGALTALTAAGVTINKGNVASTGFASGATPSGILADSTGTHLYVTDQTLNQVATYSLSNGIPTPIGTAVQTDAGPMGMTFDLSGKYLYVTAYSANTLDGYTLNASGLPVRSTVMPTMQTGTGPTCAAVIGAPTNAGPSHGEYLYTSNQLGGNVTGLQLNQQDGSLVQIPGTPFSGSALPTCLVTVPAFPLR